jgi:hypothetical protein
VLLEGLDRRGRALAEDARSAQHGLLVLAVMSGFCSEPESANSFSMIFWVSTNQE